jgi:hypothetical protein
MQFQAKEVRCWYDTPFSVCGAAWEDKRTPGRKDVLRAFGGGPVHARRRMGGNIAQAWLTARRRCFLRRAQRVLPARAGRGRLLRRRGPRYAHRHRHHHPRNPHTRSPRRAGPPHPRAHLAHPEALQVPREQCVAVRRQSPEPWSFRRRPVRVPPLQAAQWSGRPKGVLRCAAIHHGERCQGLRGRRLG